VILLSASFVMADTWKILARNSDAWHFQHPNLSYQEKEKR
jgi:hypothetical protein